MRELTGRSDERLVRYHEKKKSLLHNLSPPTRGASPPASELDPMAHYVGVYKSLFGQNDLFGSPERQQIADTAKSQGLSLKELSAVAEKRAKEKRLRALEELEA